MEVVVVVVALCFSQLLSVLLLLNGSKVLGCLVRARMRTPPTTHTDTHYYRSRFYGFLNKQKVALIRSARLTGRYKEMIYLSVNKLKTDLGKNAYVHLGRNFLPSAFESALGLVLFQVTIVHSEAIM